MSESPAPKQGQTLPEWPTVVVVPVVLCADLRAYLLSRTGNETYSLLRRLDDEVLPQIPTPSGR